MTIQRRALALLLALTMLSLGGFAQGETAPKEVECRVAEVDGYGNALLDISAETLLGAGYEMGDVLTVIAGGTICSLPLVGEFADVDEGRMLIRGGAGLLELAIRGGSFTSVCPCKAGDTVLLWLAEKGGYLAEYTARVATYEGLRAPDYAEAACWAIRGEGEGRAVDVFLLCSTVDMGENGQANLSLDNAEALKAFRSSLNGLRGVYDGPCRVFAPYYRQMAMTVYSQGYTQSSECFLKAYDDVAAAFSYYLENFGGERPFIVAGFSQGSELGLRLLKEILSDEALRQRLVAAYLIGWRVTPDDLAACPYLQMARSADDTGVIVSYNTETEDAQRSLMVPEGMRALAINPLSWSTDNLPAGREMNLGACFLDENGAVVSEIPALTGAYIDPVRGTLKATDVDEATYPTTGPVLGDRSWHQYDYAFFYRNLQENVLRRVQAYLSK